MKKIIIKLIFLFTIIMPINIYAYSDKIIIGGETIGIEVKSNGVYVVGFYEVNNKLIAQEAGFKVGDLIKEIDNKKITTIDDINNIIVDDKTYNFKIQRNNNNYQNIKLSLTSSNNIIKTGLYVKDKISGIGTLSYIDPETKVFASLGHEIIESNSLEKFSIKSGNIFKAEVTNIKKSENRNPGSKNANIFYDMVLGDIYSNEINGIYGIYSDELPQTETIEVCKKEDIYEGTATIRTVISGSEVNDYTIKILDIDNIDSVKNIYFEITDTELLNKTNGIIQGMSGSPIIQDNKIIGVVNYVVLDDTTKGYGIFIEKMLEEGDKVTS